jgi:hypothetical protein
MWPGAGDLHSSGEGPGLLAAGGLCGHPALHDAAWAPAAGGSGAAGGLALTDLYLRPNCFCWIAHFILLAVRCSRGACRWQLGGTALTRPAAGLSSSNSSSGCLRIGGAGGCTTPWTGGSRSRCWAECCLMPAGDGVASPVGCMCVCGTVYVCGLRPVCWGWGRCRLAHPLPCRACDMPRRGAAPRHVLARGPPATTAV